MIGYFKANVPVIFTCSYDMYDTRINKLQGPTCAVFLSWQPGMNYVINETILYKTRLTLRQRKTRVTSH